MVIFFVITNIFVLFFNCVCMHACVCMCGMQKNREGERSVEEGGEYTRVQSTGTGTPGAGVTSGG